MAGKILNFLGTFLMVVVIFVAAPLVLPKLFGVQIYEVLTGSMEPTYRVGSVIYVCKADAEKIDIGDTITYTMGTDTDLVLTHRVVGIDEEHQTFTTKGDANKAQDPEPVAFHRVIGRPVLCIPGLGKAAAYLQTTEGKALCVIVFAASFICFLLADLLKKNEKNVEEETEKKKEKKAISRFSILQIAGFGMIAVAAAGLIWVVSGYLQSDAEYEKLEKYVHLPDKPADGEEQTEDSSLWWQEEAVVEFDKLKEINEDVIAWIAFDNLDISYPVLYSGDNGYYLRRTFNGTNNTAGSIFMEAANEPDFSDYHTILYGHNMKNGSMFGKLKNFKEQEFYEENQYFTIYTQEAAYRFHIFSVQTVPVDDKIYTVGFGPDEEFKKFAIALQENSLYDTGVEVSGESKIVTLSTCTYSDKLRFVVHGVCVEIK